MWLQIYSITLLSILSQSYANLEGPFLFFGPQNLHKYRRPALKFLEQDDLMRIYEEPSAVVVFNNQDSVPLASGVFPRLRKMLEGQTTLVLPQDFLDVHPDYISNETQMLILQGPWSERDAQMTETFARLEDIYGEGHVLGILGNSASSSRSRREAKTPKDDFEEGKETPDKSDKEPREREKPARALPKYALYNATGPPGKGALVHSTGYPLVQWSDGVKTALDTPVGEPTVKPNRVYTNLVVRFADPDSDTKKITVEFHFKKSQGWWSMAGAEVQRGTSPGISLLAPPGKAPSAVLGKAYHCSLPLVLTAEDGATLTLPDIRIQPFMESTSEFSDAFDCIGFTSVPIWSGLMVVGIMLLALFLSICMILDIHTMDRFENNRAKQLTITVNE